MLKRSEKEEIISGIKANIEKAQAVFVTNLIGITANDSVSIRKKIRDADGKVIIARNTLYQRAAQGTECEKLLAGLKGPNAIAFAFDDAAAVAKCLKVAGEDLGVVELKGGVLNGKDLSSLEVKALADLPSRDEMLGTLLATFMAPISAFARVVHAVKEKKEQEVEATDA